MSVRADAPEEGTPRVGVPTRGLTTVVVCCCWFVLLLMVREPADSFENFVHKVVKRGDTILSQTHLFGFRTRGSRNHQKW